MTIASASLSDLRAAYEAVAKVEVALRDYNQGTNSPDKQLGRFTVDEVDELVTDARVELQREVLGGLTTFATMSYIVFVQPAVLQVAGMPGGSVLLATCLSSAAACLLMGLVARYPFALAPGMGENFFFAFTVVLTMGTSIGVGYGVVLEGLRPLQASPSELGSGGRETRSK